MGGPLLPSSLLPLPELETTLVLELTGLVTRVLVAELARLLRTSRRSLPL